MADKHTDPDRSPSRFVDDLTPGGTEGTAKSDPAVEAALRRSRAISRLLDDAFRIPGTDYRIGLDPIVGILPVAGDAVTTAISLYPILEAYRFGLPRATIVKMLALVAIDAGIGSLPVIGPVFDAGWKANKWNLRTLERHLRQG